MTTANAAGEPPGAPAADSLGERLRAWSVVAVGIGLGTLPVFGSVGSTSFFTPDTSGERPRDSFVDVGRRDVDRLHVVDCTGATGQGSMDDSDTIKYVGSPGDLTGIGIGIVKCTRGIGDDADAGIRLSLLSLSTLLRYSDSNRVFNFLHTVTGRVSVAGYLGVATLDPTSHATEVVNTLTSQFDVVV